MKPTNCTNNTTEIKLVDGIPRVFSADIAERFGKRHDDVLKTIKRIISDVDEDFGLRNFAETPQVNDQNGQTYPAYSLTRDAFALVAMSFTGKEALAWKVRFIEAFNALEATVTEKIHAGKKTVRNTLLDEAPEVHRQRCVKMLKAFSAIWAHTDDLSLSTTDTALCAHLGISSLDTATYSDFEKSPSYFWHVLGNLENAGNEKMMDGRQGELLDRIACGCEQLPSFRDNPIFAGPGTGEWSEGAAEKALKHTQNLYFWRLGYSCAKK